MIAAIFNAAFSPDIRLHIHQHRRTHAHTCTQLCTHAVVDRSGLRPISVGTLHKTKANLVVDRAAQSLLFHHGKWARVFAPGGADGGDDQGDQWPRPPRIGSYKGHYRDQDGDPEGNSAAELCLEDDEHEESGTEESDVEEVCLPLHALTLDTHSPSVVCFCRSM